MMYVLFMSGQGNSAWPAHTGVSQPLLLWWPCRVLPGSRLWVDGQDVPIQVDLAGMQ